MVKYRIAALLSLTAALAMGLAACRQTEKTEQVTAEIEAAQMQGREAARWLLHRQLTDSASAAQVAETARARKYELEKQGKHREAAAFDTAFVTMVRTVRPDLKIK